MMAPAIFGQTYVKYSEKDMEAAEMAARNNGHASKDKAVMSSRSHIDWTKKSFTSNVSMDVVKAGIPMPSGKASCVNRIQMQLPVLIKDPLLSIYVDDEKTLGDMVLEGKVTLEDLTRIIDGSKQTPAVFAGGGNELSTTHSVLLNNIGALLVKHRYPYTPQKPIDTIATRAYTGIVIDARGTLPVHGEFVKSKVSPCLFPKIWNENMDLLYERNMVDPNVAKGSMIVQYGASTDFKNYESRVGKDPLWITAKKVYGQNRCDPVISWDDYLRIASNNANLNLLAEGKVVIILDKDELMHDVYASDRNRNYYLEYERIRRELYEDTIPQVIIQDTVPGMEIDVENLNFVADSAELLETDKNRIRQVAQTLKTLSASGEYTIMVEGHTADVNKPEGQLQLSIQRAQTVIDILAAEGLDRSLFSYRGYGGTQPVDTNDTAEGRAKNRRVKITVMPKGSAVTRM